MRRLAIALVLWLVPALASAQPPNAPFNGTGGYPNGGYPGAYQPYSGLHDGHARTLPPGRRAPRHPHHDPFYSQSGIVPTVVIDGNAFLTPVSKRPAIRAASTTTSAQQQDQFGSWATEKP